MLLSEYFKCALSLEHPLSVFFKNGNLNDFGAKIRTSKTKIKIKMQVTKQF
jgi:hypothetical protein